MESLPDTVLSQLFAQLNQGDAKALRLSSRRLCALGSRRLRTLKAGALLAQQPLTLEHLPCVTRLEHSARNAECSHQLLAALRQHPQLQASVTSLRVSGREGLLAALQTCRLALPQLAVLEVRCQHAYRGRHAECADLDRCLRELQAPHAFPSLTELHLTRLPISSAQLVALCDAFPRLRALSVRGLTAALTSDSLAHLHRLTQLEELSIDHLELHKGCSFPCGPQLRSLELSDATISSASFATLNTLTCLQHLAVWGSGRRHALGFAPLPQLGRLRKLHLELTLDERTVAGLAGCSALASLSGQSARVRGSWVGGALVGEGGGAGVGCAAGGAWGSGSSGSSGSGSGGSSCDGGGGGRCSGGSAGSCEEAAGGPLGLKDRKGAGDVFGVGPRRSGPGLTGCSTPATAPTTATPPPAAPAQLLAAAAAPPERVCAPSSLTKLVLERIHEECLPLAAWLPHLRVLVLEEGCGLGTWRAVAGHPSLESLSVSSGGCLPAACQVVQEPDEPVGAGAAGLAAGAAGGGGGAAEGGGQARRSLCGAAAGLAEGAQEEAGRGAEQGRGRVVLPARLATLRLGSCEGIPEADYAACAPLPRLTACHLSGCHGLTGCALRHLLAVMPRLQQLRLQGALHVADDAVWAGAPAAGEGGAADEEGGAGTEWGERSAERRALGTAGGACEQLPAAWLAPGAAQGGEPGRDVRGAGGGAGAGAGVGVLRTSASGSHAALASAHAARGVCATAAGAARAALPVVGGGSLPVPPCTACAAAAAVGAGAGAGAGAGHAQHWHSDQGQPCRPQQQEPPEQRAHPERWEGLRAERGGTAPAVHAQGGGPPAAPLRSISSNGAAAAAAAASPPAPPPHPPHPQHPEHLREEHHHDHEQLPQPPNAPPPAHAALRRLELHGAPLLSTRGVACMLRGLPALQHLRLDHCQGVCREAAIWLPLQLVRPALSVVCSHATVYED